MTIFRSRLVGIDDLKFVGAGASQPDFISVEVYSGEALVLDVAMDKNGQTSVIYGPTGRSIEFDLHDFRTVLMRCEDDLNAWRSNLMEPGNIWSDQ
jgi:hypothetical protein